MFLRNFLVGLAVLSSASIFAEIAIAQTPSDEALMRWELGINNSRIDRLRETMPTLIPDCKISANESELTDFFKFWRQVASEKAAELEKHDQPDYTSPRSIGPIQIGATVPLRELEKVGPDTPGALEAAREQIEIWHLFRCVDTAFHGNKYFGWYGYDGIIRADNIQVKFARVPDTQIGMMIPSLGVVEPIEALGNFFHTADEHHLLSFRDADERRYFFQRYDTDYFVNLRESDVTKRWFQNPPWANFTK